MPTLCTDCLRLIPFGWTEQPCARCDAASARATAAAAHNCATLAAFGWDALDCPECAPAAAEVRTLAMIGARFPVRLPALVA